MELDTIVEEIRKEMRKFGEDLVYIKGLIENNNSSFDLKLKSMEDKYDEKFKVANHRIDDLESADKWKARCFWGVIITAAVTFALKGGLMI